MTSHRITPLTESGLLSALTVILALAAVYLPVVGVVASLVWAIPVIVLVVRHGLRWGAMAVLVSGVIMALLIEPTISLRMVLSFGPTGLVLGYAFRRRWSGAQAFGTTLVASVAGKLLTFGLLFLLTSVNPLNMQMDVMQQSFDETFAVYEQMGMDKAAIEASRAQVQEALTYLNLLLPFVVGVMGLLDAAVAYIVGSRVLRRLARDPAALPGGLQPQHGGDGRRCHPGPLADELCDGPLPRGQGHAHLPLRFRAAGRCPHADPGLHGPFRYAVRLSAPLRPEEELTAGISA